MHYAGIPPQPLDSWEIPYLWDMGMNLFKWHHLRCAEVFLSLGTNPACVQ